ncbi:protein phosphatase 2C domain-containing protein [Streptomyces sp. NPDC020898]|uniref:protein phosphatase 2C domain-containing protein n=1 Tax=Streptomyces sp. NPDC020898 TaxID=3365101 RepID=UPI0037A48407
MSQQGERSTGHEDDWWGQLYDDSTEDTGPTAAGDSLDDRFASAADTVGVSEADAIPGKAGDVQETASAYGGGAQPVFGRETVSGGSDGSAGSDGGASAPADASVEREGMLRPPPPVTPPRSLPPQRGVAAHAPWDAPRTSGPGRPRAPWEPPPALPGGPATFPPGPKPPGFRDRTPPPPADVARFPAEPPTTGPGSAAEGSPAPPDLPSAGQDGRRGWGSPARSVRATPMTGAPRDAASADSAEDSSPAEPPTAGPGSASESSPAPPDLPSAGQDGRRGWGSPARSVRATPMTGAPRDAAPAESTQDSSPADFPSLRTPTRRDLPALPPETPTASEPFSSTVDGPPTTVDHVGSGPPTYAPEPTALPPADPDDLGDLVADTVLDGAHYGAATLRAVSLRGDSARFRGEPRRDSLLTARFGSGDQALVLIAMATGARATPGAHRAAAEACQWIGRAVGRSHVRLAEDIRAARRGDLKSGLHRLTDRSLGKLRASAAEQGIEPEEYTAGLRCLLLPADPDCRTRVFFGVGAGGLFRLRNGEWQDIEPRVTELPAGEPVVGFGSLPHETPDGDRLTMDLGITTPPSPYETTPEPPREPFRFRASVARPGDTLLLCTGGLAEPLRGEPELCEYLTGRWSGDTPPGLAAFLADTQVRVKGYADDRTAAAVWEA